MGRGPRPKLDKPNRAQGLMDVRNFDDLVPEEHPARAIVALLEKLDLSEFEKNIASREGEAGRPATSPSVLLALWLYALSQGEGSAREIARLTETHDVYRWIRGEVGLNHHMLSDFRTQNADAVNALLRQLMAGLMDTGFLRLKKVAQDGTKIRANAGSASFRSKSRLEQLAEQANQHIIAVDKAAADSRRTVKQQNAQKSRAKRRAKQLERALKVAESLRTPKIDAKREAKGKPPSEPRASTTDPDARIMKDGAGGYRPGYNCQLATDADTGLIVGAYVSQKPADNDEALRMMDLLEEELGRLPKTLLLDAGYFSYRNIDALAERNVKTFMSLSSNVVRAPDGKLVDPLEPRDSDSPAVAAMRVRMKSESGRRVYASRGAIAELPNADIKERLGLRQFPVRGLEKVSAVLALAVLAHNVLRIISQGWMSA